MTTWNLERGHERPVPPLRRDLLPNPKDMPPVRRIGPTPTVGEMHQSIQSMFEMLVEAENRDKAQTASIENLGIKIQAMRDTFGGRIEALERERDVLTRARDNLVKRVTELEHGASGRAVELPPTPMQVVRQLVLEFFQTHRGMKLSPEMIRANIEDQIPPDAIATAVPNSCRDLRDAGLIKGGGTNSKGNRGPSGTRGIYWMEAE